MIFSSCLVCSQDMQQWLSRYWVEAAIVLALLIIFALTFWFGRKKDVARVPIWMTVLRLVRAPLMITAFALGAQGALVRLNLHPDYAQPIFHALQVLLIAGLTWLAIRAITGVKTALIARYDISVPDNLRARHIQTQARVLSRTLQTIIIIFGIAAALMTFEGVRQFGVSLLASAGIAGIAVGLAARPTLENLIAGIQIALTQPIRIQDVVIVEGEWGTIEEIATTYVVVKIWDDRRLVVPLRQFIDTPFQNWTRRTSQLLGTIFVYCDYTVDVDAVRAELKRLCEQNPNWDGRVAIVQVTDVTEHSVQLRGLVSAANASKLWDLRVAVREGLVRFVSRRQHSAAPRYRATVEYTPLPGDQSTTHQPAEPHS